ncbi:hypothetical protein Thi970DRAFT_04065 [Thiorhodovibrio frisius]|uniref:Uncharacterized protein n=1 Tax=Thiorhodovibrio frisius TaxID=631362 RepID=H8Z523_9GAMM|nr:hypothetical protein [Thiorhodovibrio frisius]EIC20430.1 hypothetical protein Thi970DRAFT_04065 [Thiorhodovibrio frisius]WPL21173.1 hypothetical protein Thiofri_01284 [Thiorhodovibrio frisius]
MRVGRVALFVLFAFASIIVPVVVILVYALLTFQPPFIVTAPVTAETIELLPLDQDSRNPARVEQERDILDVVQSISVQFPDGGRVVLMEFPALADMPERFSAITAGIPTDSKALVLGRYLTYHRRDNGLYGVLFYDAPWILISEAKTKQAIDEQFRQIAVLEEQPKSGFIALTQGNLGMLFGVIGIYCALLVLLWLRMASWAAGIDRASGIQPLPVESLRARLLAINETDAPFMLQPGKQQNELIAEWKYADAKWVGIMAAGGLKSVARIKLRLDGKSCKVRSQDTLCRLRWTGAAGSGSTASARLSASWFRGIAFAQYDTGFIGGLILTNDAQPTVSAAYHWKFNIQEMKQPLVAIITQAGWDWKPVITFSRLLNG